MDTDQFIQNIAAQFHGIDAKSINLQTKLDEINGWDSLTALSIMTMLDEEYGVSLEGDDLMKNPTVGDLYDTVKSRFFHVLP